MKRFLVFDIGGTAIKYALMDEAAKIFEKAEMKTPLDGLEAFLDAIESVYQKYADQVSGIALSMPGNLDSKTGQINTPGALLYNANINIIEKLSERISIPIAVENDGKCAALAELWQGNLQDVQDAAVLILGTGVGGAFIHDRQILKGKHFFAGEVSFMITDPEKEGFERFFALKGSTTALIYQVAQLKQTDPTTLDGRKIFEWYESGDADCDLALDTLAKNIATQIFNIQCFLDPERVCIGGGISKQPVVIEKISTQLQALYDKIPIDFPKVEIAPCAFYNDSNLIGALYNFKLQHP